MEVFTRSNIGPDDYTINTWTTIHEVKSSIVGSMLFYFCATNVTGTDATTIRESTIDISARIIDKDNKIVHSIVPLRSIEANNFSFDSSQKIIMKPGDKLQVKASSKGIVFYSSIITGLKMVS